MLAWDHWHIEPSSICTLRCPRCPRAEVPEGLLNRHLTLEFFQTQFGAAAAKQTRKVTFCGNDGDPIYCRDLAEICVWFKSHNPEVEIVIITNGSYRQPEWWRFLGQVLDHRDEIHWSLDGWDQISNQQYRVNSSWDSIMTGIQAFTEVNTTTFRVWASIAFRFNEFQLLQQQGLARDLGFDVYQLTKSTKFGSKYPEQYGTVDLLEPTQTELVSTGHRFERITIPLTTKIRPGIALKRIFWQRAQELDKQQQHSGICLIGNKGIFLNSRGELYPCCWTANRYQHNQSWHELAQSRFNLWHNKLADIQKDPFWRTDFLLFDSQECRTKCTRDRLTDREHTTEW